MHIGIVGSGFAGLAAAQHLSGQPGVAVTVLEREAEHGGRARVVDGAEHCTRFFMDDYSHTLRLLREVPGGSGTLDAALREARRFVWLRARGWVEISSVYPSSAPELTIAERWALTRASSHSLLVARASARNANEFGTTANYTPRYMVDVLKAKRASRRAYVLPGPTDRLLVDPWVEHLVRRGVEVREQAAVERLELDDDGVSVICSNGARHRFDALIVTAFVHDAYDLLDRSGIARRLDWRRHTHCKCLTLGLDPREPVLLDSSVRAYTSPGLVMTVQPRAGRCIVLATTAASTDDQDVLDDVARLLDLRYPPTVVRSRDNLQPASGVFAGDCVDPIELERAVGGRVFFAGSYTATSYVMDSAESACRSALLALHRLAASRPADCRDWALADDQDARPARSSEGHPSASHPNPLREDRGRRLLWRGACFAGAVACAPTWRLTIVDESGIDWSSAVPSILSVTVTGDVPPTVAFAALGRVGIRPRLVVGERAFAGLVGRALNAVDALPWIEASDASPRAVAAALRVGEPVAVLTDGPKRVRVQDGVAAVAELAAATGADVVPVTVDVWPGRRPRSRQRVVVSVGRAVPEQVPATVGALA